MRLSRIILLAGLLAWQEARGQLILTEEENIAWINRLRDENELAEQLAMLRMRILSDTNVYVKNIGDRVVLRTERDKGKELGLCKPMLIVEGYFIQATNDTDNQIVEDLADELVTDNIKQLKVVDGEKAKALFGRNGWCGVILLSTTNRKARKSLLRYKL
jgi:prophage tail gpP-like protein